MNKTWKAVLGIILIYIFGCFSGVVSTSIFFHHKMLAFLQHPAVALSAELERRLTGNLGLDDNQKKQVDGYFLDNLQQRKELQKEIQPRVQMLNRQTVQQVTAILTPDQAKLFHQNIEKFRKHFGENPSNPNAGNPSAPQAQPAPPATTTNTGAGNPPAAQ
jgi:hypothetical protein